MTKLKDFVKKNYLYIIAILALLLFSGNCANNYYQRNEGERTELKKQISELKNQLAVEKQDRKVEKDSIQKDSELKDKKIKAFTKKAAESENKVKSLLAKNTVNKKRITSLNYIEAAKEINKTYGTKDAVASENSVNLQNDLPNRVLETIADANTCQDVITEKDSQIQDKNNIIVEKDGQIKNGIILLNSAEKEIKNSEVLQAKTDELVIKTEKSLKAQKVKGTVKTLLIVGAFIGGVLIAK